MMAVVEYLLINLQSSHVIFVIFKHSFQTDEVGFLIVLFGLYGLSKIEYFENYGTFLYRHILQGWHFIPGLVFT